MVTQLAMQRMLIIGLVAFAFSCGALPTPGFLHVQSVSIASQDDRRSAFRQGYESYRAQQYEAAKPQLDALVAAGYPEIQDYVLFYSAQVDVERGDQRRARASFSKLLSQYPQSALAPRAALGLGQILQKDNLDERARPLFERARTAADARTRAAATLGLGRIALRVGDLDNAHRLLMEARREGRGTTVATQAREELAKLRARAPLLVPQGADAVAEVKLLLDEGDAEAADKEAQRASAGASAEELARLRELQARALLARGRAEEAFVRWWAVVEEFPNSAAAPDALFRIASTLWNRDRDQAAARAFRDFLDRFPSESRAPDALYGLARIEQSAGRNQQASAGFNELLRRYPSSKVAFDAQWRIGWMAYQDGDSWQAATQFAALAERSQDRERQAASYWRARAHERGGRAERAREIYSGLAQSSRDGGYYPLLARTRLRGESAAQAVATAGSGPAGEQAADEPEPGQTPASLDSFHVDRWRELRAAGVRDLARGELDAVAEQANDADSERFLLRAYIATDGHARAIRLAQKLGGARLGDDEYRRILYPLAFWPAVREEAEQNRIDPLLVVALMRQESLFDPEARSIANARGLMQLLPATASRVSQLTDGRDVDAAKLNDPRVNIHLGVHYLRNLIDRFDGDVFKAVAAYNGGESAADRWQSRMRGAEPDEFVESISYRETRDYVKRVIGNYDVYRRLYAG